MFINLRLSAALFSSFVFVHLLFFCVVVVLDLVYLWVLCCVCVCLLLEADVGFVCVRIVLDLLALFLCALCLLVFVCLLLLVGFNSVVLDLLHHCFVIFVTGFVTYVLDLCLVLAFGLVWFDVVCLFSVWCLCVGFVV